MTRRLAAGCFVLVTAFASPEASFANGRFPRAERLLEDHRDPNHLLLAATYGLLTTRDRGKNWNYICENAFAKQPSYDGDPLLELLDDGTRLVGVDVGINRSGPDECDFTVVLGGSQSEYVPDFTVVRNESALRIDVYALHATLASGRLVTRIERSRDAGVTFQADPGALPLAPAISIDVAPSDRNFVYVTGLSDGAPTLLSSADGGQTFRALAISTLGASDIPYIAAIHPRDPRVIFVRTDARSLVENRETANDALLVSRDAGETWTEIHRVQAQLLGFALAPDGSEVLLGYGATGDAVVAVDEGAFGVYRGSAADDAWHRVLAESVTCLTWTERGIYACTSPAERGHALGVASRPEAADETLDLTPLLELGKVRGPACCGAPPASACEASWLTVCELFGSCAARAPNSCDAGDAAPSANARVVVASGGCACRQSGFQRARGLEGLLGFALFVIALGRRLHAESR